MLQKESEQSSKGCKVCYETAAFCFALTLSGLAFGWMEDYRPPSDAVLFRGFALGGGRREMFCVSFIRRGEQRRTKD